MKETIIAEGGYVYKQETLLTVLKTSLFFANDGYSVYDCKGQLVFRVDSYGPDTRDKGEIVLMDAHGKCLLTVRRKVWTCSSFSQLFSSFFFTGDELTHWVWFGLQFLTNMLGIWGRNWISRKGFVQFLICIFGYRFEFPFSWGYAGKSLTFKILSQLGESFILSTILLNSV